MSRSTISRSAERLLLVAQVLLAACAEPSAPAQPRTEFTDSAGVAIAFSVVDTAAACEVTERVRIGSAAGDSTTQLFGVWDAVMLQDGRIAVLNRGSSEVRIFGSDGRFVHQFGREGDGPGEFRRNLWSLERRADTLVVGDYFPWRFSFFTGEGGFLRSVDIRRPIPARPEVAVPLSPGSGSLVGHPTDGPAGREFEDVEVVVVHHDPAGATIDTVGAFWFTRRGLLDEEIRYVGAPVFGARAAFAGYPGDTLAYAPGRSEQVELWTPDGTLRRIVRWRSRDRRVRPHDVDAWELELRQGFGARLSDPRARQILEAQVGDHRPVEEVFPATAEWSALHVTPGGTAWVKEYRRPLDEGPDRWLVFHRNGTFACQARAPEGLNVFDVGEDYVLGMMRDEMDVEYVVAYDVTLPPRSASGTRAPP